jgi:hypothetical protein
MIIWRYAYVYIDNECLLHAEEDPAALPEEHAVPTSSQVKAPSANGVVWYASGHYGSGFFKV